MKTISTGQQNTRSGNRYGRSEWAGAFGDLGTLIPFIVGYISIVRMDPRGVLFMLGILLIGSGLYYKTPIPVQPMKAIGAAAIASSGAITPGMIWGAGLFTGVFWLSLGLSGQLVKVSKIASKPVLRGIVLGLGLLFMMDGLNMMRKDFLVAGIALLLTFALLKNKKVPAMFVLLIFGMTAAVLRNPAFLAEISKINLDIQMPEVALGKITVQEIIKGILLLGIPQIPLTFGNAVVAITSENNRLFPAHPVNENKIAISQGIMNLISPLFGGIPVCHGAGGMAGHVRFGARTGGALVILGGILLATGIFFGSSVLLIFEIFPQSVLGVILFFAGLELAAPVWNAGMERKDQYLLLVTAVFSLWNIGIGFAVGLILQELFNRKWIDI